MLSGRQPAKRARGPRVPDDEGGPSSLSPSGGPQSAARAAARKRELERQRRNLVSLRFNELDAVLAETSSTPGQHPDAGAARRIDKEAILKDAALRLRAQASELTRTNARMLAMTQEVENLRAEKVELRSDRSYVHAELLSTRAEVKRLRADNIHLWQAIRRTSDSKPVLSVDVAKIPAELLLRAQQANGIGARDGETAALACGVPQVSPPNPGEALVNSSAIDSFGTPSHGSRRGEHNMQPGDADVLLRLQASLEETRQQQQQQEGNQQQQHQHQFPHDPTQQQHTRLQRAQQPQIQRHSHQQAHPQQRVQQSLRQTPRSLQQARPPLSVSATRQPVVRAGVSGLDQLGSREETGHASPGDASLGTKAVVAQLPAGHVPAGPVPAGPGQVPLPSSNTDSALRFGRPDFETTSLVDSFLVFQSPEELGDLLSGCGEAGPSAATMDKGFGVPSTANSRDAPLTPLGQGNVAIPGREMSLSTGDSMGGTMQQQHTFLGPERQSGADVRDPASKEGAVEEDTAPEAGNVAPARIDSGEELMPDVAYCA